MTVWGKLLRRTHPVEAQLVRWETEDNDFIEILRSAPVANGPRMIILHGLEGSTSSHYVRALMAGAARRGWGADLLIFRSCGTEMNRTSRLYHSGETRDLDMVVRRVMSEAPDAPLLLVGISLGGNVLLKWLGEQHDAVPGQIRAAAAVSVPFDLARSSRAINSGFARLYERVFLRTLLHKAADVQRRHPGALNNDVRVATISSMWEFDDKVTAPLHGFRGAAHYYQESSSLGWLGRVDVPTLLLSARDDPFLPADVLTRVAEVASENSSLQPEFHARGGHVGFVAGRNPLAPRYFAEERVCEFLAFHLRGRSDAKSAAHHST